VEPIFFTESELTEVFLLKIKGLKVIPPIIYRMEIEVIKV